MGGAGPSNPDVGGAGPSNPDVGGAGPSSFAFAFPQAAAIDILSVDGAFAAVTHDIWPPSWSGDRELESSMN